MLLTRGTQTLKSLKTLCKPNRSQLNWPRKMSGHQWFYRSAKIPPKKLVVLAEVSQGIAWWWVLWHLWTEPNHVLGEFAWPEPEKWSDEELGIPKCVNEDEIPEAVRQLYKKKDDKKCD